MKIMKAALAMLLCMLLCMILPIQSRAESPAAEGAAVVAAQTILDEEYAMWFMDDMNFTQEPGGGYSHAGTYNFDVLGVSNRDIKAPFSAQIVAIMSSWASGNTVVIQSLNPVRYVDGSYDYMSMAVAHDNDISDCWVGRTLSQGTVFCQNGDYGNVTGVHSHVTVIRGKYTDHPGMVKCQFMGYDDEGNEVWTWSFQNAIHPADALFISRSTNIYNTGGSSYRYGSSPRRRASFPNTSFDAFITHPASEKVLGVNTATNSVELQSRSGAATQLWHFTQQSDGSYIIASHYNTSLVLDVNGAASSNGTNVGVYTQWGDNNGAQRWIFYQRSGGYFVVPECAFGCVLDLCNNEQTDGANIQIWEYNESAAQTFSLDIVNVVVPTGVSISGDQMLIKVGASYRLSAQLTPDNVSETCKGIFWSSSDPSVASVDASGLVTGLKAGKTQITASSIYNSQLSDSIEVAVTPAQDLVPTAEWQYSSYVTENLFADEYEVEYCLTEERDAETSPGEGWVQGETVSSLYVNVGEVYSSKQPLEESNTRVLLERYYYHYCKANNGGYVNYELDSNTDTYHEPAFFDAFYQSGGPYQDSNPDYYCYNLKWVSGEWAGGDAYCGNGHNLWYIGYRYQNRELKNVYHWTYESGWLPMASYTASLGSYRYRLKGGVESSFTLRYDANGGTNAPEDMSGKPQEEQALSTNRPFRAGHLFMGWADAADAAEAAYQPGDAFTLEKDTTLYAVWLAPDAVLPASLTCIEESALEGCAFHFVLLPDTVERIDRFAFLLSAELSYIYIPSSTTSIDKYAFLGTTDLTIVGETGSYAETWAGQHGFAFRTLSG